MDTLIVSPRTDRRQALEALFDPRSIAIIGASDDPEKYGNWLSHRALAGPRPTYLVNSRRPEVLGQSAYPSVQAIGKPVDLAIIAVPAQVFEVAVDDALAAGVRAIIGITASIGETGEEGRSLQASIAARVRAAGSVLIGPNCLGVLDTTTNLDATVNDFAPGNIALLSQSGNVAIDLAAQLEDYDLGISRFVSLGNQADLDAADLIEACIEHEGTAAIALYAEGIRDGRRFVEAATRASAAGKPLVLLAAGRSEASARGAASHTGSMVSSHTVLKAACDAAAVEFVSSPRDAADLLQALVRTTPPRGPRTAVFADGGGHASLASDALDEAGLEVDPFCTATQARIQALLPHSGGTSNPIDTAGAGERDPQVFVDVVAALAEADDVDITLLTGYLGGYGQYSAELAKLETEAARAIATTVQQRRSTLVAQLMFDRSSPAEVLRARGVAVYRDVETAAWVLQRLLHRSGRQVSPVLPIPEADAPITHGDYWNAREALAATGIEFVNAARVSTEAELRAQASHLGFPRVMKALGDEHKSDRGGVLLGIRDETHLVEAWNDLQTRLRPPAVSIEEMADLSNAVELIIGVRRDPVFGPIVLVGAGGTLTELLHDSACALGPISPEQGRELLEGLRVSRLLQGYRGRPPVDLEAAAHVISKLSHFAAAHPEIAEIECNPVAVTPDRALALDARIILG